MKTIFMKTRKTKRITAFVLAVLMICAVSLAPAAAAENEFAEEIITDASGETYNTSSSLTINGTTAKCVSGAGKYGITSISALQKLEVYFGLNTVWVVVPNAYWRQTVNYSFISMSNTKSGLSSGRYRVKTVFTITKSDGQTETVTIKSAEKTVS